ncbi:MAG: SNF2-related protein [Lentisphaeria bacterium]|jgi:superfamily II DNA or RNA helicase
MSTPYHAKYFAHDLTRQGGQGLDLLSRSLFDARVDVNPHQIEAALFALRSPLAQGVILADEVGLGKTIEAGLVLCQSWAEQKRRLLVICPASLRKQWALELADKFNLPCRIVDAATCRQAGRNGGATAFATDAVLIVSMHFAAQQASALSQTAWDLVVVDEAHKLRNAYRESNRIGQEIHRLVEGRHKLLLTATPLQNSLLELYGLCWLVDGHIFGDAAAFRSMYANAGSDLEGLRDRLGAFCQRTLRRNVTEFVRYTARHLITRPFTPTEAEQRLYEEVSAYLRRPDSYALPERQRHLITMLVRKVLASSPQALAGTLEKLRDRLLCRRESCLKDAGAAELLIQGETLDDEILDELIEDAEEAAVEQENAETAAGQALAEMAGTQPPASRVDLKKLAAETGELTRFITWARGIGVDTKAKALLKALEIGFAEMAKRGAARKAVVFTESRRTQQFVKAFLEANGHAGRVLSFNGSNKDADTAARYQRWLAENRDSGRATGSFPVDVRTAILDEFATARADILIGTEAAAEGLNLQFCSLVINYDLPWNPQRIEQRIGRCHRYGQEHDVVVINFLNERNEADRRVHELLNEKFHLFEGVFGASDDVLGSLEAGMDFERRVFEIHQRCRTAAEIRAAFARLQAELEAKIQSRLAETRRLLLEHFDADVHSRLRVQFDATRRQLDRVSAQFWTLTKFILAGAAEFAEPLLAFDLHTPPAPGIQPGRYHLIAKGKGAAATDPAIPSGFLYRLGHPLGEHVLAGGKAAATPPAHVTFDLSHHPVRLTLLEALKGQSGWLTLQRLAVDSYAREEYLLFSAVTDAGAPVDQETSEKLFLCAATVADRGAAAPETQARLAADAQRHVEATLAKSLEANSRHFQEARDQLEKWADDQVKGAERELASTKEQIKDLERQARIAPTLKEQEAILNQIASLEKKKRRQRQDIFDVEDAIKAKRDELIAGLQRRLAQHSTVEPLFTIRWEVV